MDIESMDKKDVRFIDEIGIDPSEIYKKYVDGQFEMVPNDLNVSFELCCIDVQDESGKLVRMIILKDILDRAVEEGNLDLLREDDDNPYVFEGKKGSMYRVLTRENEHKEYSDAILADYEQRRQERLNRELNNQEHQVESQSVQEVTRINVDESSIEQVESQSVVENIDLQSEMPQIEQTDRTIEVTNDQTVIEDVAVEQKTIIQENNETNLVQESARVSAPNPENYLVNKLGLDPAEIQRRYIENPEQFESQPFEEELGINLRCVQRGEWGENKEVAKKSVLISESILAEAQRNGNSEILNIEAMEQYRIIEGTYSYMILTADEVARHFNHIHQKLQEERNQVAGVKFENAQELSESIHANDNVAPIEEIDAVSVPTNEEVANIDETSIISIPIIEELGLDTSEVLANYAGDNLLGFNAGVTAHKIPMYQIGEQERDGKRKAVLLAKSILDRMKDGEDVEELANQEFYGVFEKDNYYMVMPREDLEIIDDALSNIWKPSSERVNHTRSETRKSRDSEEYTPFL